MLRWWRWWKVFVLEKTQGICNPDYRKPVTSKAKSTQTFYSISGHPFFLPPHVCPLIEMTFIDISWELFFFLSNVREQQFELAFKNAHLWIGSNKEKCVFVHLNNAFVWPRPLCQVVRKVSFVWLEVLRIVHYCPALLCFALRSVSCLHLSSSSAGTAGVLCTLCPESTYSVLNWFSQLLVTGIWSEHYDADKCGLQGNEGNEDNTSWRVQFST